MCFGWTCLGLLGLRGHLLQQGHQGTHAPHAVQHILEEGMVVKNGSGTTCCSTSPQQTVQSRSLGPGYLVLLIRSPQTLLAHPITPVPDTHAAAYCPYVHTHLHVPCLYPVARQTAIQPLPRGQVQADVVLTGLGGRR
jgi:hypothetical protein